jgi:hypothetical protein
MGAMDDHDTCWNLDDFPFLPGVDLTLGVQVVIGAVLALVAGAGAVALIG